MIATRTRTAAAVAAACIVSIGAFASGPAGAKPQRPAPTTRATTTVPAPPSTTAPAAPPTPVSASVIVVPANSSPYQFESSFYVQVSPASQLGDAELLSGPTVGGPGIVLVNDFGRVSFLRVITGNDYSFRYRNKVWNPSTGTFTYSPWVQFTFRAPILP